MTTSTKPQTSITHSLILDKCLTHKISKHSWTRTSQYLQTLHLKIKLHKNQMISMTTNHWMSLISSNLNY
jgi:hypothetical protein